MSQVLRVTAGILRFGAAVSLAALAFRFAQASVERTLRVVDERERAALAAAAASSQKPDAGAPAASSRASRRRRGNDAPAPSGSPNKAEAPRGQPIRMPVSIMVGPEGSPVYINRRKQGTVPFIGEITCSAGEAVHVNVVPPRGVPLSFEKSCEKRPLRLK